MEALIEMMLSLLWDMIKTAILQWIIIRLKEWWNATKESPSLQHA